MLRLGYLGIKGVNPNILVIGGKGMEGTACYDYAQWVDVLHMPSGFMSAARAATEKWNHVLCPVYVNTCGLHSVRGGNPVSQDPFYERYRSGPYPEMVTKLMEGARAIFNEDYVDTPDFHYYHYTKRWAGKKHAATLGGALEFTENLPDMFVEDKTLQLARVNQMGYRLAPILLPAKVPQAQVAVLHTPETFFLFDSRLAYTGAMAATERLFEMLHMRHDVLHAADLVKDLGKYKVLMLTAAAECVTKEQVETIEKFYDRGGTVIFLDGSADLDTTTLQYQAFLGEFKKRLGIVPVKLKTPQGEIRTTANRWTPSLPSGELLRTMKDPDFNQAPAAYEVSAGQTAIAKIGQDAVMIANPKGQALVLTTGPIRKTWRPTWDFDRNHLALFRDILTGAGVKPEVVVSGDPHPERVTSGVLVGKGYWIVASANFTRENENLSVRMDWLPAGNYDVVDLTGERPIIQKDAHRNNHLAVDMEMREAKVLAASTSAEMLARNGVKVTLEPLMGRMWVVRPAGQPVIADAPAFTFKALSADVVIVPGDGLGAAGKGQAERIRAALSAQGCKATVATEADIKRVKTHNEVKVDGHLLETFDNEPLATEKNLILIGSGETNGVVKHLGAPGTFTYDKVLEKVTGGYPGPGRGVLALVDSVNDCTFNATDKGRDAILVGGSDAAGTEVAVAKFISIISAP
jgi:hypothetical protein